MWHLRCWFRDNRNKFRFSKFTSCPLLPTWKNFLAAQVTALLFSPHLKSFPILYSSYVICLFCTSCMYLIFFLWPWFLLITFICFFSFFFSKVNLLFFNPFCFFSLSPAVVILYRESFLMYSFFHSLSPPAPNNNVPSPSRTHAVPIQIPQKSSQQMGAWRQYQKGYVWTVTTESFFFLVVYFLRGVETCGYFEVF